MRIILHIGSDKTGTTSIQATFNSNREKLESSGILYPKLEKSNHHHQLVREIISNKRSVYWEKIQKCLNSNMEHLIISSEMLCSTDRNNIKRLGSWLSPHDVVVICYVRRADEYLESANYQRLKDAKDSNNFFRSLAHTRYIPFWANKFVYIAGLKCRFVRNWAQVFPGRIIVRPYDNESWINNDLIDDFIYHAGLSKTPEKLGLSKNTKNLTPNLAVVYAMHALSNTGTPWIRHIFSEVMTQDLGHVKSKPSFSYWQRGFARLIAKREEAVLKKEHGLIFPEKSLRKTHDISSKASILSSASSYLAEFIAYRAQTKSADKRKSAKHPK